MTDIESVSTKAQQSMRESLERFRRAHRAGMRALKSSDVDRVEVFARAVAEERLAVEAYYEAAALRRVEMQERIETYRSQHPRRR